MAKIQKSFDKKIDEIEAQVARAWRWAKIVGFFVIAIAAIILLSHLEEYIDCRSAGRPVCDPTFAYLRLNEWGDYFAGFGATVAFIFVGTGLYVQMKEMALQRLETIQARLEQMKSTKALAKTADNNVTLALFEDVKHQLELLPKIAIDMNGRKDVGDETILTYTLQVINDRRISIESASLLPRSWVDGADPYFYENPVDLVPERSVDIRFRVRTELLADIVKEFNMSIWIIDEYPKNRKMEFRWVDGSFFARSRFPEELFDLTKLRKELYEELAGDKFRNSS